MMDMTPLVMLIDTKLICGDYFLSECSDVYSTPS